MCCEGLPPRARGRAHPRPRPRPRQGGFTLMEILVVFVLAGIVSGVLMQALAYVYRLQQRFGAQLLRSEAGAMQVDWYRQLVQTLQPDYGDGADVFSGDARGFRGLALDPFRREQGAPRPVQVALAVQERTGLASVRMTMAGPEVELARWPGVGAAAFRYLDAQGVAHDRWPPGPAPAAPLPAAVELRLAAAAEPPVVIVAVPRATLQPLRQLGLAGGAVP